MNENLTEHIQTHSDGFRRIENVVENSRANCNFDVTRNISNVNSPTEVIKAIQIPGGAVFISPVRGQHALQGKGRCFIKATDTYKSI